MAKRLRAERKIAGMIAELANGSADDALREAMTIQKSTSAKGERDPAK